MDKQLNTAKPSEQPLVIEIELSRRLLIGLIAAILLIAALGYLALERRTALAGPPLAPQAGSSGLRQYYRTNLGYTPTGALQACAAGYHFASLWELVDTSNLQYAFDHPDAYLSESDQGWGPPSGTGGAGRPGWVRTGYAANVSSTPGQANCNAWTSTNAAHFGTIAGVSYNWGTTEDIGVWYTDVRVCSFIYSVWCVED